MNKYFGLHNKKTQCLHLTYNYKETYVLDLSLSPVPSFSPSYLFSLSHSLHSLIFFQLNLYSPNFIFQPKYIFYVYDSSLLYFNPLNGRLKLKSDFHKNILEFFKASFRGSELKSDFLKNILEFFKAFFCFNKHFCNYNHSFLYDLKLPFS